MAAPDVVSLAAGRFLWGCFAAIIGAMLAGVPKEKPFVCTDG